jgi:hypothetical protein
MQQLKGVYYVSISSNQDMEISLILVKQSLIHLLPLTNNLLTKGAIFELYSQSKSAMIEIFNCRGEVSATAS